MIAARFGGDEFVLLTTLTPTELQQAMARLTTMLASASPTISCSMGMAPYRGDFAAAFARADTNMYQHKRHHKELRAAQMPAIGESINH